MFSTCLWTVRRLRKRASAISLVGPVLGDQPQYLSLAGRQPCRDGGASGWWRGPGGDGIDRHRPRFLDGLLQGQRPASGPSCSENVGTHGVPEGFDVPTVEGAGGHDQGLADRVE